MFDRKLFYTLASITAVIIIVVTLSSLPKQQPPRNDEDVSQTEAGLDTPAPIEPEESVYPAFVVKEHEGHIAIFYQNETTPHIILETLVKFLPDYDQIQLKSGIAIYSYDELATLIEDYVS